MSVVSLKVRCMGVIPYDVGHITKFRNLFSEPKGSDEAFEIKICTTLNLFTPDREYLLTIDTGDKKP